MSSHSRKPACRPRMASRPWRCGLHRKPLPSKDRLIAVTSIKYLEYIEYDTLSRLILLFSSASRILADAVLNILIEWWPCYSPRSNRHEVAIGFLDQGSGQTGWWNHEARPVLASTFGTTTRRLGDCVRTVGKTGSKRIIFGPFAKGRGATPQVRHPFTHSC